LKKKKERQKKGFGSLEKNDQEAETSQSGLKAKGAPVPETQKKKKKTQKKKRVCPPGGDFGRKKGLSRERGPNPGERTEGRCTIEEKIFFGKGGDDWGGGRDTVVATRLEMLKSGASLTKFTT